MGRSAAEEQRLPRHRASANGGDGVKFLKSTRARERPPSHPPRSQTACLEAQMTPMLEEWEGNRGTRVARGRPSSSTAT